MKCWSLEMRMEWRIDTLAEIQQSRRIHRDFWIWPSFFSIEKILQHFKRARISVMMGSIQVRGSWEDLYRICRIPQEPKSHRVHAPFELISISAGSEMRCRRSGREVGIYQDPSGIGSGSVQDRAKKEQKMNLNWRQSRKRRQMTRRIDGGGGGRGGGGGDGGGNDGGVCSGRGGHVRLTAQMLEDGTRIVKHCCCFLLLLLLLLLSAETALLLLLGRCRLGRRRRRRRRRPLVHWREVGIVGHVATLHLARSFECSLFSLHKLIAIY